MSPRTRCAALAIPASILLSPNAALAHSADIAVESREAPAALAVRAELPPAPAGVTELRFRDLVKLPIGPRGLEPGDGLRAHLGKRVRLVGFMVRQAEPVRGQLLLSPLPVEIGNADEGLADDVPAALVEVVLSDRSVVLPYMPGLLKISGTLETGGRVSADDPRSAFARIRPDPETAAELTRVARPRPN